MELKIACISDTHNNGMPHSIFPDADILIHAGDGTSRGTIEQVKYFAKELGKLGHAHQEPGYQAIIFVPGNHDWLFEKEEKLARNIMAEYGIITLINESIKINGFNIWGSPVCPPFYNWAFYKKDEERKALWDLIPKNTDILITHGPPKYILDEVQEFNHMGYEIIHTGCAHLHNKVIELKPKAHIFGHIHEGYGQKQMGETLFVNAALMNRAYVPVNDVQIITINKE